MNQIQRTLVSAHVYYYALCAIRFAALRAPGFTCLRRPEFTSSIVLNSVQNYGGSDIPLPNFSQLVFSSDFGEQ